MEAITSLLLCKIPEKGMSLKPLLKHDTVSMTYYDTLKLQPAASSEEIRVAYKSLARIHHPDKNFDQESAKIAFQRIAEAYEVLSDPLKKRAYDYKLGIDIDTSAQRPMPSPFKAPPKQKSAEKAQKSELRLDPEKLPQDLDDVIDSDSSILFQPYLNKYGKTPLAAILIRACRRGKVNICRLILNEYPELLSSKVNHFFIRGNLIHLAYESGNVELVRELINRGLHLQETGPFFQDEAYTDPLYLAVASNFFEMVQALRVNRIFQQSNALFELSLKKAIDNGSLEIVQELLKHNTPWPEGKMMGMAIKQRNFPLMQLLSCYTRSSNWRDWSIQRIAIVEFGCEKVKELVENGKLNPFHKMSPFELDSAVLARLFQSIGLSCEFELLEWFEKQFEVVRKGLSDKNARHEIILSAAFEQNSNKPYEIERMSDEQKLQFFLALSKKFGRAFCKGILTKAGLSKDLRWKALFS